MKKIVLFLILFFASSTFFLVNAQTFGEHIVTFTDDIIVNKDATLNVKETIVYDFYNSYKHGIYRNIPTYKTNQDGKKYRLDYSGFTVTDESGKPYQFLRSNVNDDIQLKIGSANKTVSGVHTYVIGYKVSGAISYFSDHDELYWNTTGNQWTVPIGSATSNVELPTEVEAKNIKTACYTGVSGSKSADCANIIKDTKNIFTSTNKPLNINEGLTTVVSFPKNIVAVLEPKPYTPFDESLLGKLLIGLMGLIGLMWYVLAPIYIIYRWYRYGRDPRATIGVTAAWFDAPKSVVTNRYLMPGEVGTLGDESADLKDISATIVDLARRGYLTIDERSKGDYYFVKNKKYANSPDLLPYEEALLNAFFTSKDEFHLKDENIYDQIEAVKNLIYDDVVKEKLFPQNPKTVRTIYYVVAGVAFFTGNLALAIVAFIFGRIMPKKTLDGANAANIAKSLKNFLESQERQLEFQADKQMIFEKLLPYAIVFGVEKIWAKRFQNFDIKSPNWYRSYSNTGFNSWILVSSLNSSMSSFQSVATPVRSTSGFSSGFGGGGFSGGGGGGGGGGSW